MDAEELKRLYPPGPNIEILPKDFFVELGYSGRRKDPDNLVHQPSSGKKKKMTRLVAKYYKIMKEYKGGSLGTFNDEGIINPISHKSWGWVFDEIKENGQVFNPYKYADKLIGMNDVIFEVLGKATFISKIENLCLGLYMKDILGFPGITLAKLGLPKFKEDLTFNENRLKERYDDISLNFVFKYNNKTNKEHYEGIVVPLLTNKDRRIPDETRYIFGHIFSYVVKDDENTSLSFCDIKYYGLYSTQGLLIQGLKRAIMDHGGKSYNEE